MGVVTILPWTNKEPLSLMGYAAGYCWGSPLNDNQKNVKRALECIQNGHGRVSEFGDVYMTIEGYSARFMRELYTHIGGAPTRLQESTRYVEYDNLEAIIPPTLTPEAQEVYNQAITNITDSYKTLLDMGVKKEDAANILPLGMKSKMVFRVNARTLIEMSHQRECSRAYWEFRKFFADLKKALKDYSEEWALIVDKFFMPKCEYFGYCSEKFSCGRKSKRETEPAKTISSKT